MSPRLHLPPELVRAIRPSTWRALFSARGYPAPLSERTFSGKSTSAAGEAALLSAISDAVAGPLADMPAPLASALFLIPAFATEAGRTDVYNAAEAISFPSRWPDAISPADLIAHLLAASATDAATARLVKAAKTLRDRAFRSWDTLVYLGAPSVDASIGEPTQYADAWHKAFSRWAPSRDFGAVLPVDVRREENALVYTLVHEGRRTAPVVATREGDLDGASSPHTHRALRSHVVAYEPARRRLTITTDALEVATPLARMAGTVFFDDPRHFLDEASVALWKLQELGERALHVPELGRGLDVTAIGGTWHSGKKHAITPRGQDFFKALERYKIGIEGGRLDLVTLRAELPAGTDGPPTCDVALRPPHLVTVSEPELAPLMDEYLDAASITNPEPRPLDFFTLQPWIDSRAEWVALEGPEGFASLLARGLLRADKTNRAVVPPEHPHAGRTATAYPLDGTTYLAWSPDASIPPFLVDEKDLVLYALSFERLAASIAEALGLEGPASRLDEDGVLYCGRRALGPTHVLIFLLTRHVRPTTLVRLREAADHGHAILIAPEGRVEPCGLRQLPMPKLSAPWHPLLSAMVRALRLESKVETPVYAPANARVVLHRATMRLWIDGVPCASITEAHFLLLEILVMHAGQTVHTKDIAEHIAKGHQHEDTTRRAIDTLPLAIEKSFKGLKKKPPKDLRSFIARPRLGHYTLAVAGFVD